MKILYITNFYSIRNSSAAVRNNALVKGLIENGHSVDVLTVRHSDFSTSPDLNQGNIIFSDLFNLSFRGNIKKKIGNGLIKKLIIKLYESYTKIVYFPDGYYNWPNIVNPSQFVGYDMMISSSDGKISHFVGRKLKASLGLFWIQIWGDPWLTDINTTWYDKIRIPKNEKNILNEADKIVYVSEVTANLQKKNHPQFSGKINYIPRSYYNISNTPMPLNNEIHIIYAGMISATRWLGMYNLLKVVAEINETSQKKIFVDIYGKVDEAAQVRFSNFNCAVMHGLVDADKILEYYQKSHVLLYISNVKGSSQIPGKLFDYMGVNRPVFCIVDSSQDDTSVFLNRFKDKCYVAENNELEIKQQLDKILALIIEGHFWGLNQEYSPATIANAIINL